MISVFGTMCRIDLAPVRNRFLGEVLLVENMDISGLRRRVGFGRVLAERSKDRSQAWKKLTGLSRKLLGSLRAGHDRRSIAGRLPADRVVLGRKAHGRVEGSPVLLGTRAGRYKVDCWRAGRRHRDYRCCFVGRAVVRGWNSDGEFCRSMVVDDSKRDCRSSKPDLAHRNAVPYVPQRRHKSRGQRSASVKSGRLHDHISTRLRLRCSAAQDVSGCTVVCASHNAMACASNESLTTRFGSASNHVVGLTIRSTIPAKQYVCNISRISRCSMLSM